MTTRFPQYTQPTIFAALSLFFTLTVADQATAASVHAKGAPPANATIWQDRGNVAALDLLDGPGGKEHQPAGNFKFIDEDKKGTSPKFNVEDEQGVRWRVKLGQEVKSETAATRLVWAAGYYADEDYYLPQIHVDGLQKLSRGNQFVMANGMVRDVRLKRKPKGEKKDGDWSWFNNPFVETKEFNGLRIMMAMINNWDLAKDNNAIYQEKDGEARYLVSDLGASFGKTGNSLTRSKSDMSMYESSDFVQNTKNGYVDFHLTSRPFIISIVNVPNYHNRTHMQEVAKKIPVADAKWLGQILAQLTPQQIEDCFRAAGYDSVEVTGFAGMVKERIDALNKL